MTPTERSRQWREAQKANGMCQRCTKPAKRRPDGRPMSYCPEHLAMMARRAADCRKGRTPVSTRSVITKDMLLHDLKCVAERLSIKRVSMCLYEQEGSFSPQNLLARRIKQRWSDLCVEAGLLPTDGHRGVDDAHCRCGRNFPVYLRCKPRMCWRCRQVVRKRKAGDPTEVLGVTVRRHRPWAEMEHVA